MLKININYMQHLHNICIRAMASISKQTKLTLSSKLAKQNKVVKPKAIITKQDTRLLDIEDLPGSVPRYFSPVQTRSQRQVNNAGIKIKMTDKKARQIVKKDNADKDLKSTEIKICSATIIKCEVVPESSLLEDKRISLTSVKMEVESPNANWWQQLENVRLMRAEKPAPVDSLGCHQCADKDADEKTQRFHKLVALMLSSQTKDETTFEAMNRLKTISLTPGSVKDMPIGDLEKLLHPVSFYKNKAKYLKQTSQILIDKYNADIPDNIQELLKLPGVGPKMGHICMATAWNKVTGIGVDTHVHRIANRLAWLKQPTKEPEQTRIQLESWLPKHLWAEVNHLFVGFGQTICTPLRPNCGECLNKHICPASTASKKS
ncbi:endonuclease III-like protein 1 isoform X1 [Drosophila innubila]|uniref:endonuclease III-like protein 1 isoform X1 n=2 Tax=Drosophila innubila TaxID=198719 RepID=UPI00148D090C|nr:endonuclease III-like protein 1 isoform X1 [Drosophila innubila]